MTEAILKCQHLDKHYQDGERRVDVLKGLNFELKAGETVAVIGPSGSGKSTLLHVLGGLDTASSGAVFIKNQSWQQMSELKRCQMRNTLMGFVYQFHHLLPEFSALENVMMPLLIQKCPSKTAKEKAIKVLDAVGLANRAQHRPAELSGGERQRVAIARAIITEPACILADEPTGNLDAKTATNIFELLLNLNKNLNTALLVVTHDLALAAQMDKQLKLDKGCLL